MSNPFYDGVFTDANRTNEACGRSFHIPAESEFRRPSFVMVIVAAVVVAASLVGMVVG